MNYYYIYKITDLETGRYYIGKRTSRVPPELDTYYGSGNWVKKLALKYSHLDKITFAEKKHFIGNSLIIKDILAVVEKHNLETTEKLLISDKWKNDKLCMNQCEGGLGTGSGADNHAYDREIYRWYNLENDIWVYKTQSEMISDFNMNHSRVSNCIRNPIRYKSISGWFFAGTEKNPYDPVFKNKRKDYNVYTWKNKNTKEILNKTRKEMMHELGLPECGINKVVNGTAKSVKGWTLASPCDKIEFYGKTK